MAGRSGKRRKLGLTPRFALLSLAPIVLIGVVLARTINSDVTQRNLNSARKTAVIVSRVGIQSRLTPPMLAHGLTKQQLATLDRSLGTDIIGHSLSRVKIWNRSHRVVYSDDAKIIGKVFPPAHDLVEALDGTVSADVSNLQAKENVGDRKAGRLLEVYVPIAFSRSTAAAGAFEVYLPYEPIAAAIAHDTHHLYLLLAAGLGLLWLVLFRLVYGASKRLRRHAQDSQHQATHDLLTQLPNRLLFLDRLDQAILAAGRTGRGVAVVLVNLDRFKEVNDTLGHDCGDLLLCNIGPRLQGHVRASDTVARLGGDEFALLLTGIDDAAMAMATAETLREAFEQPFHLEELTIEVEVSMGIALHPDHGSEAAALLQHADIAIHVAKAAHSGIEIYMPEDDRHTRDRLTMVGELRSALSKGELVLHFQPKIALPIGTIVGVEALLRWQHPQRGLIMPDDFLPVAEHTGLIRPLTSFVLAAALEQCSLWRASGHPLTVAVNLAARNLHDLDLPTEIATLLDRFALPPRALQLEITESAIMTDPVRAMGVANSLRELGVGLSIDDFGTGYSSLSYLKQFPIREIKIDKSFVIDMASSDADAAIVRSTIGLAHNLGLEVVAEGVETAEVLDKLTALGCDVVQGYFLCRPIPAATVAAWIDARMALAHAT